MVLLICDWMRSVKQPQFHDDFKSIPPMIPLWSSLVDRPAPSAVSLASMVESIGAPGMTETLWWENGSGFVRKQRDC